jgi:hypothetical protein
VYSGPDTSKSFEMEALSTALVAVGSGLQTIFQFTILHFIVIFTDGHFEKRTWIFSRGSGRWSPVPILIICLVFSFMSASYNMGRAIMYQMSNRWTFVLNATGIVGGTQMAHLEGLVCYGYQSNLYVPDINVVDFRASFIIVNCITILVLVK